MTLLYRSAGALGAAAVVAIADYLLLLTDCAIAGREIGETALGAMNLLFPAFSLITFCLWLVASGTVSAYVRARQRGDELRAADIAGTGVVLLVSTGLLLMGFTALLERPYLAFMGPDEATMAFSGAYWQWYPLTILLQAVELAVFYLVYVNGGEFGCIGAYALQLVINVWASYWLGERYGMAGVSFGSVVAYAVGIAVLLPRFFGQRRISLSFGSHYGVILHSLRQSLPGAFVWLLQALIYLAVTKYLINFWGSEALPVAAVVFCVIRSSTFFGSIGATFSTMAQHQRSFRVFAALSFAFVFSLAAFFLIAPEPMIGLFGLEDPEIVEGARLASRITIGSLVLVVACALGAIGWSAHHAKVPSAALGYLQSYILSRMAESPDSQMFNLAKLFRLRKGIDLRRLADALVASARTHGALYTVFRRDIDGTLIQRRELGDAAIACTVEPANERELLAQGERLVRTFDLSSRGFLDAHIYDCGDRAYLLSNFHHLVCDGYSFPLILEGARKVYEGGTLEQDDYYGVLAKREERSRSPVATAARTLLRETLKDPKFVTLPRADFHAAPGYSVYERPFAIPANFDGFLTERRLTRHHVFLAATALALAKVTDANDVLIDWVFHGRVSKEELRTVGAFMVDLPLLLENLRDLTGSDVLSQVKQATFRGIKNVNVFRDVLDLNPDGRDRLTFNYQDEWGELISPGPVRPDGPYGWMIEETIPLLAPHAGTENPFNVEIVEHRDGTRLLIEYDSGRYSHASVKRYAEIFLAEIDRLVKGERSAAS